MCRESHAQLALAVVDQPLAGAAAVQVGHVPARDRTNVVGAAVFTRRPRQVVLAVVQLADDDGAVDVAIDKVHQHFGARTRCEHRAPVGTRHALGHTHPSAAAGVTRGMAGGLGAHGVGASQSAIDGRGASLPGELDAHATIAVSGDWVAISSDHDGGLRAWGHARRCRQRHQAHIGRHGLEVVAVAAFVQVRRLQNLGRFGTQVVGRFVGDADDLEVVVSAAVIQAVFGDGKRRAFAQGAHRAVALGAALQQVVRSHPGAGTRIGGFGAGMQGIGHAAIGKLALRSWKILVSRRCCSPCLTCFGLRSASAPITEPHQHPTLIHPAEFELVAAPLPNSEDPYDMPV